MSESRQVIKVPGLVSRAALASPDDSGGNRVLRGSGSSPIPELTVVTITYNCAGSIARTISSVLEQRIPGLEYIVVDGGSTDGTLDIIRKYERQLEYWASEKDKGIADAFNKGISLARGGLVGLLNSGDVYEPGALAAVLGAARASSGADVLYGRVMYRSGPRDGFVLFPDHSLLKKTMSLSHPGCFVRLDAYRKYGIFDDSFDIAMDYELLLRFYCAGASFKAVDALMATMDMEGVSNRRWVAAIRESARVKRRHLGVFRAYSYFLLALLRKSVVMVMERAGLRPLLDEARERRRHLKRVRTDDR